MQILSLAKNFKYRLFYLKFAPKNKFIEACLIAFLVLILVFPDVIFNGASFRTTDQLMGGGVGEVPRNFYPAFITSNWSGGYNDTGGALFQSEPMMDFVRDSIATGQSIYWNPYSGIGSLGPETLVDQKFSLFTIMYALSWGGPSAYNSILLSLYFFSIVFLCLIIRQQFSLSIYAAITASIFFLLNGYSSANFGSNISQNYLYLPMCLYSGFRLIDKITLRTFAGYVSAFTVFLSCTFIPTEITSFFTLCLIFLGYLFVKIRQCKINYQELFNISLVFFLGIALSLLILSAIYIPVIINIINGEEIETYAKRIFFPINFPQAILSLFSPTHLYESYNAMESRALLWSDGKTLNGISGNTVYHMGGVAILLAGCAINFSLNRFKPLLLALFVCLFLGFLRLFSPYPLEEYFSMIPIVGNIAGPYWWPIIVFPMCFLVAFGAENLLNKKVNFYMPLGLMIIGLASLFYVYNLFGLQEPNYLHKKISIAILVFTLLISSILIYKQINEDNNNKLKLIGALMLILFAELILDSKMIRMPRHDDLTNDPSISMYLRENATKSRTLTIGYGGVYPELGSALKIQEITSLNFGVIPEYVQYFKKTFSIGNTQMFYGASLMMMQDTPELHKIEWKNIDLLGVKFIILPAGYIKYNQHLIGEGMQVVYRSPYTTVYLNPNHLPRAFVTDLFTKINSQDIALEKGFEAKLQGLVIKKYENTVVEISGRGDKETLVVLTDAWHKNWSVVVNGNSTKLLKVDGVFRGVIVPSGEFTIEMKYEPILLKISFLLSCIGAMVLMIILIGSFNLKRSIKLNEV